MGRFLITAVGLFAGGIRHGVALVEGNDPVEPFPEPGRHLVETGGFALAFGRAQRGIGDEKDAFGKPDVASLAEFGKWHDITFAPPERHPVAPGIFDELVTL